MTKQKEIRGGMDKLIYDRIMSFLTEDEWKDVAPDYHPKTVLCERFTGEILSYLNDNDVVIKVDRELPGSFYDDMPCFRCGKNPKGIEYEMRRRMLKWHNDSLEPLIKEG